ncbi:MAG: ATP synthase F0 subunit B [Clostridia bacterium]|nr:ATP synthase F0 subunit B [Oscillospiraceae bacterium]MBQ7005949.1 ATP synthase F0 subunit B [Clostridia bacterium]
MNIQPSVIVWTVICFVLLMVILKNLLFTPVLKVIDSRKEKIDEAEKKLREIESINAENERRSAEEKLRAESESVLQAKAKVQQIQSDGKKEIENAQRKCLSDLEDYRNDITGEYDKIVYSVAPKMETAAAIFAKNIISDRI